MSPVPDQLPVSFPMRKVVVMFSQRAAPPYGTTFRMACDVPSGMGLAEEAVHLRDKIALMALALTVEMQEKGWRLDAPEQEPPSTAGGEG